MACGSSDDVFIGPNATFTNDPLSAQQAVLRKFCLDVHIDTGASIGANAMILPGLRIGRHCMVGAGAVVTRSVPAYAIVVGNPARIVGYVDAGGAPALAAPEALAGESAASRVPGVSLLSG